MQKIALLTVSLVVFLLFIPLAHAESEDVDFMSLPKYLSERLGLPSDNDYFIGKILISIIFMALFLLPTIFACSKFEIGVIFPSIFVGGGTLGFLVALGWFPVWLFAVIIIAVAGIWASIFARRGE